MRGEATITQSFSWTEPALCSSPSHTCAGRWIGCILMIVDQFGCHIGVLHFSSRKLSTSSWSPETRLLQPEG